jgi:hypothetical protein
MTSIIPNIYDAVHYKIQRDSRGLQRKPGRRSSSSMTGMDLLVLKTGYIDIIIIFEKSIHRD